MQLVMLSNGLYFLFFCRGFKLVGPMVIMIYRMLAQDLMRFGIIYSMFIIGFSQAYYIIFQSFEVTCNCISNKFQFFCNAISFYRNLRIRMKEAIPLEIQQRALFRLNRIHQNHNSFHKNILLDVYNVTGRIWRSMGYI